MEQLASKFYYCYSCSLEQKVQIKIGSLEGSPDGPTIKDILDDPMLKFCGLNESNCCELMVITEIYSANHTLSLPVIAPHKSFTNRWEWNEWITLPINFCDLPRNAQLAITIYDFVGANKRKAIGGTTISLFDKHGMFREGIYDLRVWKHKQADGNEPTTTPGNVKDCGREQMQRLAKLKRDYKKGLIPKIDWLDKRTFSEIEMIINNEKRSSDYMYLMVEFPSVYMDDTAHSIVYYEPDGDDAYSFRSQGDLMRFPDCDMLQENLVEAKHHKLARSLRSGLSDKDAKPNATVRDQLMAIVAYPPTTVLSSKEQDLVWNFRFYLSNQKKALTKFLKCVNWTVSAEVRQALSILKQWAPMDVEDALELLTPNFTHPAVRGYAVSRLKQAPDEDLLLYLLQLVQALKYENLENICDAYRVMQHDDDGLIDKSDAASGATKKTEQSLRTSRFFRSDFFDSMHKSMDSINLDDVNGNGEGNDLASFLINRACQNSTLANYFFWYLSIECEELTDATTLKQDGKVREMYLTVKKRFSLTLANGTPEMQYRRTFLIKQQDFIDRLVKLIRTVSRESGNRIKKQELLQQLLAGESESFNFSDFEPIPFPLDSDVYIKGIVPEKATLFKSALMPSKLTFTTTDDKEYVAIFKYGDDLRQDQLILQMITLMDKLLRRENLDLKLTPYRVLATSTKHGFLQFIDSVPVAEVLRTEGTIQNFFRKHNPCEGAPYGIAPDTMDTYVRSCAGYCVITYLLGVGDRHLDNLLLTKSGKLFHIDFGYILGRDPKPLPPPMKLSKEMVEAMGSVNSEHYQEFRKQCYTAFLHLRRHANLILNLFSLMVDATVPDIALEPDKAVRKVQDKLRLDLSDEAAVHYMQNLLDLSVTAVMAAFVEQLHKFAQYWRK